MPSAATLCEHRGVGGRVALVTGGSRGIGAQCALRFARMGWDVAVSYRSDDHAGTAVTREVEALGQRGIAHRADVSSESDVLGLFDHVHAVLGELGAVVNNAGIVDVPSRLDEMDLGPIVNMMTVNVVGTFLGAREGVRRMSTRHGGRGGAIVNISSGAAKIGSPGEYVDYAASKAAVEALTVGLAREVGGEGIRVNAVRPGIIDTDIHAGSGQSDKPARLASSVPLGRSGTADEVAAAICWLCSDDASYVNGAILDVTGGR
jgi:NAD(P)-dependent dehydrogenase (short-subunit alcohol dehydrogenase family)